jgi:molybdate transport system substrate-binding protein
MRFTLPFLCAILVQSAAAAAADGPAIAAAANLTKPMGRIVEEFRSETGINMRVSYGSSGNLMRQIQQHAPFELFISAGGDYVDRLAAEGLAEGAAFTLAFGRIGALVPRDSPLADVTDLAGLMNKLKNGDFRRIAMANPEFAPFGVAAQQALEHAGVWAMEKDRIVLGENVGQAVQFTLAGGVDAGFIPLSFALETDIAARGRFLPIPAEWHAPLEQRSTLLRGAGPWARRFMEYLRQPAARAIIGNHGYTLPEQP